MKHCVPSEYFDTHCGRVATGNLGLREKCKNRESNKGEDGVAEVEREGDREVEKAEQPWSFSMLRPIALLSYQPNPEVCLLIGYIENGSHLYPYKTQINLQMDAHYRGLLNWKICKTKPFAGNYWYKLLTLNAIGYDQYMIQNI